MNLEQCTKPELIWLIKTLQRSSLSLSRQIDELLYTINETRAERFLDQSLELQKKAAAMLVSYQGSPIMDIPDHILRDSAELLKRAETLRIRWCKARGVSCSGEK